MNKTSTKTDNSYLVYKVQLRLSSLPAKKNIKVLDCFAGQSLIWNSVQKQSNKNISIIGIDKKPFGTTLRGNNLKYLQSMDLNRFDVIDLDSYGIPYKQLKLIFDTGYTGTIFITFIQTMYGALPAKMLYEIGYKKEMIDKCSTLFYKNGLDKFKKWLAIQGIKKIKRISIGSKHYIHIRKTKG